MPELSANFDLLKIASFIGSSLAAIRVVWSSYRSLTRPTGKSDEAADTASRDEDLSWSRRGATQRLLPEDLSEDEMQRINEIESDLRKLKAAQESMHLENKGNLQDIDRRYNTISARYQEIEDKIDKLTEQISGVKHELRQELRESRQVLREFNATLKTVIKQT